MRRHTVLIAFLLLTTPAIAADAVSAVTFECEETKAICDYDSDVCSRFAIPSQSLEVSKAGNSVYDRGNDRLFPSGKATFSDGERDGLFVPDNRIYMKGSLDEGKFMTVTFETHHPISGDRTRRISTTNLRFINMASHHWQETPFRDRGERQYFYEWTVARDMDQFGGKGMEHSTYQGFCLVVGEE